MLASPLALATLVSRSGRLEMGKTAALACFALMIGVLIGVTGGIYSPLAEGLATIGGFYNSNSSGEPDVTNYCQKNFVIVVSPGMSSQDSLGKSDLA